MLARHAPGSVRAGMSLLEVLIALAIFLFSLVGIGQLISYSGQHSLEVAQRGHAAQLAQAKLAEVIAGIVPMSSQSESPFEEDTEWNWSLTAEPDSIAGLWFVEVTVSRARSDGTRFESKLSQKVLDPSMRGSTLDAAAAAAAVAAAASASSSSSSSQQSQQSQQSQSQTQQSQQLAAAAPAASTKAAAPAAAMPAAAAPKAATPAPAPAPAATPSTGTKSAAPSTGGKGKS